MTPKEMRMNIPKPKYSYIGRKKCGCCTFIIADIPGDEKSIAKEIAKVIKSGRTIERITWEQYVNVVSKEETFMSCPHELMQRAGAPMLPGLKE